jgi:hypothetical protein
MGIAVYAVTIRSEKGPQRFSPEISCLLVLHKDRDSVRCPRAPALYISRANIALRDCVAAGLTPQEGRVFRLALKALENP